VMLVGSIPARAFRAQRATSGAAIRMLRPRKQAGQMAASDYVHPYPKLPLASEGTFSNRASLVKPASSSLSGSWFSPRSANTAATSGPVGKARVLQGPQRACVTVTYPWPLKRSHPHLARGDKFIRLVG
jgi:hypothetical protein